MKKVFQLIGICGLTIFSFFATEKTSLVVKEMDDIMISIKQNYTNYKTDSIDAKIIDDNIIPGINGKDVNINKSYKNMKKYGYYTDTLYVYDYTKPNISLYDNINKYIIKGNDIKRMISLIFLVETNDVIDDIVEIINNYKIKTTFFVSKDWFINNTNQVENLINNGHNVYIKLDDYSDIDYTWIDQVIKNISKSEYSFCYNNTNNTNNLNLCSNINNFTVSPIEISDSLPLTDVKDKLECGSILSLKINSKLKKELSTIIIYIKSKGFSISNLEESLLE